MDFYGTILVVKMVDMNYSVPDGLLGTILVVKILDMNNTVPDVLLCSYFGC